MPTRDRIRQLLDEAERLSKPKKLKTTDFGATEPSFGELGIFEKALDLISRPLYATAGFADSALRGRNPVVGALKGFAGQSRKSFGDVLHTAGFKRGIATSTLGLGLDIAGDPTSYLGLGPVARAGTMTVKGIPRALTAAGVAAKDAAVTAKTAQAAKVLAHPRLTPSRLERLRTGLPAEVGVLTRDLSPEGFKAGPGASAIGSRYGRDATARMLGTETRQGALKTAPRLTPALETSIAAHKGAALEAPRAIKFMGAAIPGTEALLKTRPLGRILDAAEKVPGVGKVVAPIRDFGRKAAGAGRAIFSGKTGDAEFDFKRTMMRDLLHRMNVDTQKVYTEMYAKATEIVGGDPIKRKAMNREWQKMMEGVWEDYIKLEPHPREASIRKRIFEFKKVLVELSATKAPIDVRVAGEARKLADAKQAKDAIPGQVVEEMNDPKVQGSLKGKAVRNQIEEAEEDLRITQQTDAIAQLDVDGTKISLSDEWLAKTGSTKGAELRNAIPSKYLAGKGKKGQTLDELTTRYGKDYGEEVADLLIAAGRKRKEKAESLAKLKGTKKELRAAEVTPKPVAPPDAPVVEGQGIPIPKEALPESPVKSAADIHVDPEAMTQVMTKYLDDEVRQRTKDAARKVADLEAAIKATGNVKRQAILQKQIDLARADLGVWESKLGELKPVEVRYRRKAAFTPADPRVEELGKALRSRLETVFKQESKVNPLLRHREFYLPHMMTDEVRGLLVDIIRQDPRKILKNSEFSTSTAHAMARSNDKAAWEISLQDLIDAGDVDPSKVRAYFKSIGKPMSAVDELIFEQDPVKAAMGRELAHNRAIVAQQFTDEILNSSTFVKARVNAEDILKRRQWRGELRAGLRRDESNIPLIQKILDEHEDHAIFIPSNDYQRTFLTEAGKDAIREGAESKSAFVPLLKELLEVDEENLIGAMARAAEQGKPIKAYIIPRSIAEHLSKAHRLMLDDKRVGDFLEVFDKWQGWWKSFSTIVRPAFHVRNAISNLWQNFLAGVTSPKPYYLARGLSNEAMRKAMAKIGQYDPEQVYRMALELGVLKTGFVGGDLGEFLERSVSPSKNWLSPAGPVARFGGKVGVSIEDNARLANFVDGLLKGMDPESAAMRVKKYLFDYGDLSEVEKGFFRRILPFYTFTRKSIPLAIESLLTQPGKVAVLGKARAEAEKGLESLDREYVADYINKAFGIPVYKNDKGEFEYFLLKGYIPTVDIAKIDHQELLGMLSPFIKTPVEQALNIDFYRMKPISRFPTEMVEFMGVPMPVRLAHLMRNIVLMAQIDREVFREGATVGKGLLSEASIRFQTQNPVDQMRRFVLSAQVEMGETKRLMEQARERGENYKAAQYEQRLALLVARRDEAKEKTLKLDPDAFKFRKPGRSTPKTEVPDFNRLRDQMRRETRVGEILKKKAQ